MEGLRRIELSIVVLLGVLLLGLAAPGDAAAMSNHSGHASMSPAAPDIGMHRTNMPHTNMGDTGVNGDNGVQGAGVDRADGGCVMGLMGACCVMTCCAATTPEIMADAVRQLAIAARSSRPTDMGGRVILPLLEPPKRLS